MKLVQKRESQSKLGNRAVYVRATAGCQCFLPQSPHSLILYEAAFETWLVVTSMDPPLEQIKHQPNPEDGSHKYTNTRTHAQTHQTDAGSKSSRKYSRESICYFDKTHRSHRRASEDSTVSVKRVGSGSVQDSGLYTD